MAAWWGGLLASLLWITMVTTPCLGQSGDSGDWGSGFDVSMTTLSWDNATSSSQKYSDRPGGSQKETSVSWVKSTPATSQLPQSTTPQFDLETKQDETPPIDPETKQDETPPTDPETKHNETPPIDPETKHDETPPNDPMTKHDETPPIDPETKHDETPPNDPMTKHDETPPIDPETKDECSFRFSTSQASAKRLKAQSQDLANLKAIQHGHQAVVENLVQYIGAELSTHRSYEDIIKENIAGIREEHQICDGVVQKVAEDLEGELEGDVLEALAGIQRIKDGSRALDSFLQTAADVAARLETSSLSLQASFTKQLKDSLKMLHR
ncbi:hypothetical protein UPYG_G00247590 [Umbra pygmaea]|uniref:Uncharacterized protein n=1 Tax=Umbra pygmaea TaxID=75934 RepID=A0ABD0W6X7_UMBPY